MKTDGDEIDDRDKVVGQQMRKEPRERKNCNAQSREVPVLTELGGASAGSRALGGARQNARKRSWSAHGFEQ